MSTTDLQLAEDLRRAVGGFVRRTRTAAGTGSNARSETLGLLDRSGPASTATLARLRHVKHQSMRLVLTELEAAQLVTAAPDPQDGRGKLYQVSAAGQHCLQTERAARSHWIATQIRNDLSDADRATLAQAVGILNRLGR